MYRTIASQPDLFCAHYELSASSEIRSIEMMKSIWKGTTAFVKGLAPKR